MATHASAGRKARTVAGARTTPALFRHAYSGGQPIGSTPRGGLRSGISSVRIGRSSGSCAAGHSFCVVSYSAPRNVHQRIAAGHVEAVVERHAAGTQRQRRSRQAVTDRRKDMGDLRSFVAFRPTRCGMWASLTPRFRRRRTHAARGRRRAGRGVVFCPLRAAQDSTRAVQMAERLSDARTRMRLRRPATSSGRARRPRRRYAAGMKLRRASGKPDAAGRGSGVRDRSGRPRTAGPSGASARMGNDRTSTPARPCGLLLTLPCEISA